MKNISADVVFEFFLLLHFFTPRYNTPCHRYKSSAIICQPSLILLLYFTVIHWFSLSLCCVFALQWHPFWWIFDLKQSEAVQLGWHQLNPWYSRLVPSLKHQYNTFSTPHSQHVWVQKVQTPKSQTVCAQNRFFLLWHKAALWLADGIGSVDTLTFYSYRLENSLVEYKSMTWLHQWIFMSHVVRLSRSTFFPPDIQDETFVDPWGETQLFELWKTKKKKKWNTLLNNNRKHEISI